MGANNLLKVVDWATMPADTTFCSFSGGVGQATLELARKHSHLKIILQSPPFALGATKQFWATHLPAAVQMQRVEIVTCDIFNESPRTNCDMYYLRFFLHNLSDAQCTQILQNIRRAMHSRSRLMIHEYALQHGCRVSAETAAQIQQAPEPLLPNYGVGRIRSYNQDLHMMITANGKERTMHEYMELGSEAGLKFDRILDLGENSVLEFILP